MKKELENKIKEIINQIRPYFNMDGGDIEFVKYDDGYVYVKLSGACVECLSQDETIDNNLFLMLKEEIPEIKGVINIPL